MSMALLYLPLIVIAVILFFVGKKILTTRKEKKKSGGLRKLNIVFKILCCFGWIIDLVLIGFITKWAFSPIEGLGIALLLIIPGILIQCIYFLPYLIANSKGHEQETAIFILNLFAGWTFIAWVIALVWAFTDKPSVPKAVQQPLSNADEIAKYKSLLDSGIITEEEFENKKRELLNL